MRREYIVGSRSLGFKKTHDYDYVVVCDELPNNENGCVYEKEKIEVDNGGREKKSYIIKDLFNVTKLFLNDFFNFRLPYNEYSGAYMAIYQYDFRIIDKDFPVKFDIMEHREQIMDFISWAIGNGAYGMCPGISTPRGDKCLKTVYHIAWLIFTLIDGTPIISPEHFAICEKIHNFEMPSSYVKDLIDIYFNYKSSL